jgi:hypothetical protein
MHPAQGPRFGIKREVRLHNLKIQTAALKLAPAIAAGKKPTWVPTQFELDDKGTGQGSLDQDHL